MLFANNFEKNCFAYYDLLKFFLKKKTFFQNIGARLQGTP